MFENPVFSYLYYTKLQVEYSNSLLAGSFWEDCNENCSAALEDETEEINFLTNKNKYK